MCFVFAFVGVCAIVCVCLLCVLAMYVLVHDLLCLFISLVLVLFCVGPRLYVEIVVACLCVCV